MALSKRLGLQGNHTCKPLPSMGTLLQLSEGEQAVNSKEAHANPPSHLHTARHQADAAVAKALI